MSGHPPQEHALGELLEIATWLTGGYPAQQRDSSPGLRRLCLMLGDEKGGPDLAAQLGLRLKASPFAFEALVRRLAKNANHDVNWNQFLGFFDVTRGTGQAKEIIYRRIREEEAAAAGAFQPPAVEGDITILRPDGTWHQSKPSLPGPNSGRFTSKKSLELEDGLSAASRGRLRELRTRAMRDPTSIRGWPSLDLSCLGLSEVPDWLYEVDGVTDLDLSRNEIRGLDEMRMRRLCQTLRRIDVRNNLLGDLPHLLCIWPSGIEMLFDANPGTRCIRRHLELIQSARLDSERGLTLAPCRRSEVFEIEKRTGQKHPFLRRCANLADQDDQEEKVPLEELNEATRQKIAELEADKETCVANDDFVGAAAKKQEIELLRLPIGDGDLFGGKINRSYSVLEGWPSMNLENCGLWHVPSWICFLLGLQELNLARNHLTEVSDAIKPLLDSGLKNLDLSQNDLRELPGYLLSATPELQIKVDGNPGSGDMRAAMLWDGAKRKKENLEGWPKLNLEKMGLKEAPAWLMECEGMLEVNARCNAIRTWPEGGKESLSALKVLDLTCNGLETLPAAVFEAPFVEELRLAENRLEKLPPSVSIVLPNLEVKTAMPFLKVIDVRFNRLRWLPGYITESPMCHQYLIEDNPGDVEMGEQRLMFFQKLVKEKGPSVLPNWPKLNLCGLFIEDTPAWIWELEGLKELDLSNNSIHHLPGWQKQKRVDHLDGKPKKTPMRAVMPTLRSLDLSHNAFSSLEAIPDEIWDSKALQHLRMDGNVVASAVEKRWRKLHGVAEGS